MLLLMKPRPDVLQVSKESPWLQERFKCSEDEKQKKNEEEHGEVVQQRVMEWAKELQSVSEVSEIEDVLSEPFTCTQTD